MEAKKIFEEYLMLGKSVTLDFSTIADSKRFKALLNSYKQKLKNKLAPIDMVESMLPPETSIIRADLIETGSNFVRVKFYMSTAQEREKINFIIVTPD